MNDATSLSTAKFCSLYIGTIRSRVRIIGDEYTRGCTLM